MPTLKVTLKREFLDIIYTGKKKANDVGFKLMKFFKQLSAQVVNLTIIMVDWLQIRTKTQEVRIKQLMLVKPMMQVGGQARLILEVENCFALRLNGTLLSARTREVKLTIANGINHVHLVCYGKTNTIKEEITFTGVYISTVLATFPSSMDIPTAVMSKKLISNPVATLRTPTGTNKKITSVALMDTKITIDIPEFNSDTIPPYNRKSSV